MPNHDEITGARTGCDAASQTVHDTKVRNSVICTLIASDAQWHELRAGNVGCSEVAALFGVHDYQTGYGLAARKMGKLPDTVDNPVLKRGRLLEPIAKQLLGELQPEWQLANPGAYYHDPAIRFGATPDLFVTCGRGLGVIQIKTVTPHDFASKWHNDAGALEPPLWIAIQVMGEQYLTGADFGAVAVLVVGHGLDLHLVEVPYLPFLVEQMRARVIAFWELVDRGELPAPDYGLDRAALAHVLRHDDGAELDLSTDNELPEIVSRLEAATMSKRLAEDQITEQQARILHRIGTAKHVKFAGGVIKAPTIHRKAYTATVAASDYRKITFRFDRRAAP